MTTNTAGDDEPAALPQPYFLIDIIQVRKELMQDFIVTMTQLVPVFESYSWQLISATYTLTGRPSTVMHVWQIPTADSLRNTMVRMSENTLYLKLQDTIESEEQNLLSRMPYDPVAVASEPEPPSRGGIGGPVAGGPLGPGQGTGPDDSEVIPEPVGAGPPMEKARVPGDRARDVLKDLLEPFRRR